MFGLLLLVVVGTVAALMIRAGASNSTVVAVLIGIFVPLSIALASWFLASPPIWTLLAERTRAIVQVADVVPIRDGSPVVRASNDVVDVRVRLEHERSGRLLALFGVELPEGDFTSRTEAQDALRSVYPIGEAVKVRVSRDVAYVDRQDLIATTVFVFSVVFALLMGVVAVIVTNARAGSRVKPPPS
jgi:hypothetical protein